MDKNTPQISFSEKWHAEKLLKRAKKKTRKHLQAKGHSHSEARKMVKQALNTIVNKPIKRAAGRGS